MGKASRVTKKKPKKLYDNTLRFFSSVLVTVIFQRVFQYTSGKRLREQTLFIKIKWELTRSIFLFQSGWITPSVQRLLDPLWTKTLGPIFFFKPYTKIQWKIHKFNEHLVLFEQLFFAFVLLLFVYWIYWKFTKEADFEFIVY